MKTISNINKTIENPSSNNSRILFLNDISSKSFITRNSRDRQINILNRMANNRTIVHKPSKINLN